MLRAPPLLPGGAALFPLGGGCPVFLGGGLFGALGLLEGGLLDRCALPLEGGLLERAARGARLFVLFPDWPFGDVGFLLGGGDLALSLGPWGEVGRLSVLLDGALLRVV